MSESDLTVSVPVKVPSSAFDGAAKKEIVKLKRENAKLKSANIDLTRRVWGLEREARNAKRLRDAAGQFFELLEEAKECK